MQDNINPALVRTEYAVRGAILNRAMAIQKEMDGGTKFPFDELISCNIGNPQALTQAPMSFTREVLGCSNGYRVVTD